MTHQEALRLLAIAEAELQPWQRELLEQYCPNLWPKAPPQLRLVKEEPNS